MTPNVKRKHAAELAKTLASMCVRNTELEDIHAGYHPVTLSGDYSDITVIDAGGNKTPWNEVSKIDDDQMKMLMKNIVNRMYTFFIEGDNPEFEEAFQYYRALAAQWDEPEIDAQLLPKKARDHIVNE